MEWFELVSLPGSVLIRSDWGRLALKFAFPRTQESDLSLWQVPLGLSSKEKPEFRGQVGQSGVPNPFTLHGTALCYGFG